MEAWLVSCLPWEASLRAYTDDFQFTSLPQSADLLTVIL